MGTYRKGEMILVDPFARRASTLSTASTLSPLRESSAETGSIQLFEPPPFEAEDVAPHIKLNDAKVEYGRRYSAPNTSLGQYEVEIWHK
jgi:hypothetical protein